jgi:hypothetical protein
METTQGNVLCSYLYLKLENMPCLSIYLSDFSSTKLENRKTEQVLRVWHWWKWGGGGKRGRRMNRVQIIYTHL